MHEGDSLRSSLNFNLLGARLPPLDPFDLSCERGVIASITVPMEVPTESNLQKEKAMHTWVNFTTHFILYVTFYKHHSM